MTVAGIDIGSVSAKAVVLNENKIIGTAVLPTGFNMTGIAASTVNAALQEAGLCINDLQYTVATGYGRKVTEFANYEMSEIICHAAGASWMYPETRTVIDIGGQDSKVMRLNKEHEVVEFKMNDKCAAGTGRFLEVMAKALELSIEEAGRIGLESDNPCTLSSICTVFAETEVISYLAEKRDRKDIIAGVAWSAAKRVSIMAKNIGIDDLLVFTGGVAKNKSVVKFLEQETGHSITIPKNPQFIGAIGAALYAQRRCNSL